jgi:hypothetical protein
MMLQVWFKMKGVKQRIDFLARQVTDEDAEANHYRSGAHSAVQCSAVQCSAV